MAYYVRVKAEAPKKSKFRRLGRRLGIEVYPRAGFAMAVSLWCICWEHEFLDGKLKDFEPEDIARELEWNGDAKTLVDALVSEKVLDIETDGTYTVHDWVEEQNGGIKILVRNRNRSTGPTAAAATPATGATGDDTVVRVLMQRMRECHITGSATQKREHAEAWKSRGIADKAEQVIMGEGKGLDIFSIAKMLNGGQAKQSPPSTVEALKKWAQEGDARDAAAKARGGK